MTITYLFEKVQICMFELWWLLDQEGLDDVLREPVPVHVHMVPRVAGGGMGANSVTQNVVADAVGS